MLVLVIAATPARAAGTVTRVYELEGEQGTFVVPAGVESIQVAAVGGGGGFGMQAEGGWGARVSGQLSVVPGSALYVEVGREGAGGFRGDGGAGGGASDVRTRPRAAGLSPDDRLIVAGAGGGAGGGEQTLEGPLPGNGGAAGESGEDGQSSTGGGAGTQSNGGAAGESAVGEFVCGNGKAATEGTLGAGGAGGYCRANGIEGGGGGGGYYGGGGGGYGAMGAGGGGGSSLVPVGGSEELARFSEEPSVAISYAQPPNPPAVVTEPATHVLDTSATLNASVNPEDEEVTACELEYGTSEAYGHSAPCSPAPGSEISPVAVSASVSGLGAAMTYHYRVVATNANGTSYGGDETFTTPQQNPPTLTSLSPGAGPEAGGTAVTITGTELEGATAVKFGATSATSFTVDSAESITAVSPPGSSEVEVTVTTPWGKTAPTLGDRFTYTLRPWIRLVSPPNGPAAGGTTVTLSGTGFTVADAVHFGTTPATSFTVNSANSITAVAPPGVGTVTITVTTPTGGTSEVSPVTRFGYESGAPEFGRCALAPLEFNKANDFHGGFTSKSCEEASPTQLGKYQWEPGSAKSSLTATAKTATLETVSKAAVTCGGGVALAGELASPTTLAGVSIRLKGCASGAHACTSAGLAAGELETQPLEGALGWESKAKKKVALELYPDGGAGAFLRYTCAGAAETTVTGSVLVPVKAGKAAAVSSTLKFKASKGKQKPEAFEGGGKAVLSSSSGGGPPEQTGLTLTATQTYEEAIEINPVV